MARKKLLKLIIARVDGPLFDGEVEYVTAPGIDGVMTVLADHEPLISPLKKGTITVRTPMESKVYHIDSGMLEVSNNVTTILV